MNETILTIRTPLGGSFSLFKNVFQGNAVFETLSIVTGLHGDQVNGLHISARLTRFLESVFEKRENAYRLLGKVQLFPMVNVPALETGSRFWHFDGMDMDLAFPGNENGDPSEKICHAILRHTSESSFAVVLESAPLHYDCLPHIRMFDPDRNLKKLAAATLLPIGRVEEEVEIVKTRLMRYWMERGIPAFSIVCGRSGVYSKDECAAVFNGLINLMCKVGVLGCRGEKPGKGEMAIHGFDEEIQIFTARAGLFSPEARPGDRVKNGEVLGTLSDLRAGNRLEEITVPEAGRVLMLRAHPVVYESEPIAILIREKKASRLWPF